MAASDAAAAACEQLYVSLRIEVPPAAAAAAGGDGLAPHVFGSLPISGSWDPEKSLAMGRESASTWELSFVVPPNHENVEFKFLLKTKVVGGPCIVEEGPNRVLAGGKLDDARAALFRLEHDQKELVECRIFVTADTISPVLLAASWRAYQEHFEPSRARGIPDVVMDVPQDSDPEQPSSAGPEVDLEQFRVPSPNERSSEIYAANLTENPRSMSDLCTLSNDDNSVEYPVIISNGSRCSLSDIYSEENSALMDASPSEVHASSMEPIFAAMSASSEKQAGFKELYVDRGVGGSPKLRRPTSGVFSGDAILESESKAMPAASGAVAAAAIADQMHGPKEDRKLAIVLVGLPARGKTFTAAKLTRYLRWLGHETKHFNVGKYRRLKHGSNQSADFFRADNKKGLEARNEVAALAMEDMLAWLQEGGQVGVFDATNSSKVRRNMLMKMAEGKCKIIFLETICNDEQVIERNVRLKVKQSPDYANQPDFEAGVRDFKDRLAHYNKVYEPVEEGSYIKMIDMVTGNGGQLQINNISGYLPARIVFFLVNIHLIPRPILLTRHGESLDNVRGRLGGDSALSKTGELYAMKLASFVEQRLKSEKTASIWTSTLQRTILTGTPIVGFPKIQWRALDEINAGVCDGMTYEEIKKNMPEEYESRSKDKLRYRYPRGESYLDVIQRLEPVIIELERQRAPVVVIAHQAVLRALYAYFADKPLNEIPQLEVPLHTIIEMQMGFSGVQEKRYKLMD